MNDYIVKTREKMEIQIEEKVNVRITFKVTKKQSDEFETKIKESGYSKSQVLRHLITLFIEGEIK